MQSLHIDLTAIDAGQMMLLSGLNILDSLSDSSHANPGNNFTTVHFLRRMLSDSLVPASQALQVLKLLSEDRYLDTKPNTTAKTLSLFSPQHHP